jgi:hypothetical protein
VRRQRRRIGISLFCCRLHRKWWSSNRVLE